MKDLLVQEFINHYNRHPDLPVKKDEIDIFHYSVEDDRFEIKDKTDKKDNDGNDIYAIAQYSNPSKLKIDIINYEKFIMSLPKRVKNTLKTIGTEICDLIVYSANCQYFILNELTNTKSEYVHEYENLKGRQEGKETKARRQLRQSLTYLIQVPAINRFIEQFATKHCCFFSNQPYTPQQIDTHRKINAIEAFNPFLSKNGFRLTDKDIEALKFEFWVFSGNQTYLL